MTWILFVWLFGSSTTITSQEFNSRQACIEAAKVIRQAFGQNSGFVCVEKGKK